MSATLTSEYRDWIDGQVEWRENSIRSWAVVRGVGTWLVAWLDVLAGVLAAVLSMLTGGKFEDITQLAVVQLREADRLGKGLYDALVGLIMGKVYFGPSVSLLEPSRSVAQKWAEELDPRRVGYLFAVVIDLATNFVDFLIGVIAAAISIPLLFFDWSEPLVHFARHNLGLGKLISDLALGLLKVVNPDAKGL